MRDFGDTYLSQEYFQAAGRPEIPMKWELDNVKDKSLPVAVGILHGNKAPSWMDVANDTKSVNSYDQWGRDFYKSFADEFEKQTGIRPQLSGQVRSGNYQLNNLYFNSATGMEFLNLVKKDLGRDHLMIGSCQRVFAM
jgi:hypothetical protein